MKVVRITVELNQTVDFPVDQVMERSGFLKIIQPDGQQIAFPLDKVRAYHVFTPAPPQEKSPIVNPHDGQPVT